MKRIKLYLYSVLFFCGVFTVRAATNTVDYTAQLSTIYSILNTIAQDQQYIGDTAQVIAELISEDLVVDFSDTSVNVSHIKSTLVTIKTRCDEFKSLLQSSVSDLDNINANIIQMGIDLSTVNDNTSYIGSYVSELYNIVSTFSDQFNYLGNLADNLSDLKDMMQTAINNGELNKEDTQRAILNVLTGMTDTADSIKDALDIIQQDGGISDVIGAIASLKESVTQIYRLLSTWDVGFFRYLYDKTYPTQSLDFYHISGAPFFENGYLTYSQQIGTISTYSFVDWLAMTLVSHTQGLQVINDNLLFIAKVLGTNSQEQAMAEFEDEANETLSTIQSQYAEMINSTSYTPKQFDINKTHLHQVRQFFTGLSGQNSYESVKVYNIPFNSFEKFGLPTHIEYKYDVSQTSTFWEVCRAFFTCLWVFLFAAVFFMVVRTFYHFYHICFNALAGNRSHGYEFSTIG